jgi:hypothetical protein
MIDIENLSKKVSDSNHNSIDRSHKLNQEDHMSSCMNFHMKLADNKQQSDWNENYSVPNTFPVNKINDNWISKKSIDSSKKWEEHNEDTV